ncbi:hypothetical protein Pmani_014569 [Petrolisthes manimaculis]|uniref:Uncharacterized protein n=1 Tax=Petrolisthes manimaculis TaxID=1843537 RepID=A0AAE1UCI6_9EUCA|nr:hypothetical protein Pmani_014569 [Petrolisthes manimaculis]
MISAIIFLVVVVGLLVVITWKVCSISNILQQLQEQRYYVDAPQKPKEVVVSDDDNGKMVDKVKVTHIIEKEPLERHKMEEGPGETNHRDRLQKLEERIEVVLESRAGSKNRPQEWIILTHISNEVERAKDLRRKAERCLAKDLCLSTNENEEEKDEDASDDFPSVGIRSSARLRSKRLSTTMPTSRRTN